MRHILAEGINLGLSKLADACPTITTDNFWISRLVISVDDNYYKSSGSYQIFNDKIGMHTYWGNGTTSSSDGNILVEVVPSSPLAQ
ncbi:hypothetical protein CW304_27800 [Bacillus sp. UFRGS-B20]|nr:hypothetical protein CW304_27800 [Bacillus sp. UFRGS-B20]